MREFCMVTQMTSKTQNSQNWGGWALAQDNMIAPYVVSGKLCSSISTASCMGA